MNEVKLTKCFVLRKPCITLYLYRLHPYKCQCVKKLYFMYYSIAAFSIRSSYIVASSVGNWIGQLLWITDVFVINALTYISFQILQAPVLQVFYYIIYLHSCLSWLKTLKLQSFRGPISLHNPNMLLLYN